MAIHGSHFRRWMPWLLAVTVASFTLPRGFLGAAFGGRGVAKVKGCSVETPKNSEEMPLAFCGL